MTTLPFKLIEHQNIRIVVDNIDKASTFYRNAFGAVEMQRHVGITEPALVRWFGDNSCGLKIDIGISFVPDVLTLEFYKLTYTNCSPPGPSVEGHSTPSGHFQGFGLGPQGIVVDDIYQAYDHFAYGGLDVQLSGPPLKYSSLITGQTGASPTSAARGNKAFLDRVAKVWEDRINFHFVDPMGIHWTISNNVV